MGEDFWKLKIRAFLHDPPEKAIILMKTEKGHVERAKELLKKLIEDEKIPRAVEIADQIASAADRVSFPKDKDGNIISVDFVKNPVLKHPLSGSEIKLEEVDLDLEHIQRITDETIDLIIQKCSGDLERIYYYLWRLLPELLKKKEKELGIVSLSRAYDILPADTRIPDHTIWDHRKVTAAIATGLEELPSPTPGREPEILFNLTSLLFSIGPVQSFVQTARKTQDLWAGSYILSYLSWQGMKAIIKECGVDSIIFPDLYKQPLVDWWLLEEKKIGINRPDTDLLSIPTLPNRFLVILPQNKAKEIASQARDIVKEGWWNVANFVKQTLENKLKGVFGDKSYWDELWKKQIENFLEIYWVIYPWQDTSRKEDYNLHINTYKDLLNIEEKKWDFGNLITTFKKLHAEEKCYEPNVGTVYSLIYDLTERSLGSRKVIRDFNQVEEYGYKCTLCGLREPLHLTKEDSYKEIKDFWAEFHKHKDLKRYIRKDGRERLCAVCTTKRFATEYYFAKKYEIASSFPSTDDIAPGMFKLKIVKKIGDLIDLIEKFNRQVREVLEPIGAYHKSEPLPLIKEYVSTEIRDSALNKIVDEFIRIDGEWLFEDSFNSDRLRRDYGEDVNEEKVTDVLKTLAELKRELGKRPAKYYAVLYMDGDNMGKWLSGEYENTPQIREVLHPDVISKLGEVWGKDILEQKRPLSPSLHSVISNALRNFSLSVTRHIVEKKYLGKLVYAGGDDVVAFVSLEHLFEVMRELRAYFSGNLSDTGELDFSRGSGYVEIDGEKLMVMGTKATASMGVAIAHHLQPLSQSLEAARDMEKWAKQMSDKNAFAISVLKRSGEREEARAHWFYDNGEFDLIEFLLTLRNVFSDDHIRPRFIYDLKQEIRGLSGTLLPFRAKEKEISRVMERHKNDQFDYRDFNRIEEDILKLHTFIGSFDEFLAILSVANFVAREK